VANCLKASNEANCRIDDPRLRLAGPYAMVLSRPMRDRRAVARYAGQTGAPDESGAKRREQGLARAGNARVRRGTSWTSISAVSTPTPTTRASSRKFRAADRRLARFGARARASAIPILRAISAGS
jgi:transposase